MTDEFTLIERLFKKNVGTLRPEIELGIGDDAATVAVPADQRLAVSVDTLVEAIHFLPDIDPGDLGYRALAVNLSDLAAMGAEPAWCLLSLILPPTHAQDEAWLAAFADSFLCTARDHGMNLIGGNLAAGATLSVTVQIAGYVPPHQALTRAGAQPGDRIYVTGELGWAKKGLALLKKGVDAGRYREQERKAVNAFLRPKPRLREGLALRGKAGACIDISDGLPGDLRHVLRASGVGADIRLDKLPVAPGLSPIEAATGGEDYELCFTLPADVESSVPATCIGEIKAASGLRLFSHGVAQSLPERAGYEHF